MAWLVLLTCTCAWVSLPALVRWDYLGVRPARPVLALAAVAALMGLLVGLTGSSRLARLHARATAFSVAVFTMVLALAGGQARGFGVVLWTLALCWAGGDRLLTVWFRAGGGPEGGLRNALATALGLGIAGHAVLAFGLLGLLRPWVLAAGLGLVTVGLRKELLTGVTRTARALRRLPWDVPETAKDRLEPALWSLLAAWFCLCLIQASAPEIQYDALNYHLNLPRLWIEAGSVFSTPSIIQSYYYLGAEASFTLAMLLGGQAAAKLLSFAIAVLTCVALYSIARWLCGRRVAMLAVSLFAACPLALWQASTTYVDMFLTCYCLLALGAVVRWLESRDRRWVAIAGLLAGFAVSIKLTAAIFLAPLGLVVAVAAILSPGVRPLRRLQPPLLFATGTVLSGFPWPLLRFLQTRSPIFPFFNGLFRSPLAPATSSMAMFSSFGVGTSLAGLATLPWAASFNGQSFGEALPPSAIGACLLLLPLLLLLRGVPTPLKAAAALVLTFFALWAFSAQYLRYLLPALPVMCWLVAFALSGLERGTSELTRRVGGVAVPALVLVLTLCGLPAFAASFFNIPERVPWRVAFGLEAREAYLKRTVPCISAYRFLTSLGERQPIRVLALGDESRLYFPGPIETINSPGMKAILAAPTDQDIAEVVRSQGFTHILLNRARFSKAPPWLTVAGDSFLDRYADLLFADHNAEVYGLRATPRTVTGFEVTAGREKLANGGIESMSNEAPERWQPYGSPTIDCSGARSHSGSCAVRASAVSGLRQRVEVSAGRLYTLSHFSRSDSPGGSVRGQVNWLAANGSMVEVTLLVWGATPEWTRNRLHQTAPEGAVAAEAYINAHAGEVWVDDISLWEAQ